MLWQCALAQVYEKGVSKELAQLRSQLLQNINYDLTIDIPAEQSKPVAGTVIISFMLNDKADVVLDFQGRFSGACIVNGKKRVATMQNEHIVIPQKLVKKGLNEVEMNFVSQDKALNRHGDYLYTLFVPDQARSCFPCFDQPDLRATFTTQLNVPLGWKTMISQGQAPIPTYLYSFVAGRFEELTAQRDGYPMRVFYREQDPQKLKQLPKILDEAGQALRWMEGYTGLKYPFTEFGMVILPGYQFGGMEHPGAIQLADRRIFIGNHPSQDERLSRMELIAHETAHQWFGNMVTLKWFEDVWAKEVLANFMAAKITRRQFSQVDHDLNFLRTYQARALAFDRTEGTHPIAQPLANLSHASLLYDDIIYYKAPVMMRILEDIIGPKKMQAGLQQYLEKHYFKSASWDDLIAALDSQAPQAGVRQFSDVWVKQKGMPTIHTAYSNGKLIVSQSDPYNRGLLWRQKIEIRVIYDLDHSRTITIDMTEPTVAVNLPLKPNSIIPNYNGRGYGLFTLDEAYTQKLPLRLIVTRGDLNRYALLLTLHDNYLMGRVPGSYFGELYRGLAREKNPLIMSTLVDHMFKIAFDQKPSERQTLEQCIMDLLAENRSADCRQAIIRKMGRHAMSPDVLNQVQKIWNTQRDPLFDDHDYMDMAYRLAITHPGQWQTIISQQRQRLKDEHLRQEFDFVSRACNPDATVQRQLFSSLLKAENRPHEPWTLQALQLLNSDTREPQSNTYIATSLQQLQQLQQSSDIFFASNWLHALLDGHKSREAWQSIDQFLKQHPNYPESLRSKIMVAAWPLKNTWQTKKNNQKIKKR